MALTKLQYDLVLKQMLRYIIMPSSAPTYLQIIFQILQEALASCRSCVPKKWI